MIVRNAIIAIAVLCLGFSLFGAITNAALWPMALSFAVLVALLLFERHRYQERMAVPSRDGLRPTDERFMDPESGRPVRVWLDPKGKRFYLDEEGSA